MQTSTSHELDIVSTVPASDGVTLEIQSSRVQDEQVGRVDVRHRSRFRIGAILVALYLSLFIAALDATIVSTAIPTITAHLHSGTGYIWIGGAYLLANAAAGPIWAKLSDIFGRKPVFLVAIAMFLGSSTICAVAKTMQILIVGRSLQGAAGGGLILLVNITISDLFSVRERSLWLGFCEFMWALAGGVGPILGGSLAELVSWRWCFFINLPIAGIAFILILIFLDVYNPRTSIGDGVRAIDWVGSISMIGLTLMILLGLDFGGETFPWNSPKVICLIVFGALMSLIFIFGEKRIARYPLIPLNIFKSRSNTACLLVVLIHGFVFIAGEYYLPLYFQSAKAASPVHSGVLSLPLVVSTALTGVLVGVFIHRTGRYLEPMWAGTVLLTVGYGVLIDLDPRSSAGKIVGYQIIAGIGSGCLFEPPLIALQARVAQDETATATSTLSFIRGLALALSIVVGGVVFQNSMQGRSSSLRAAGLPYNLTLELTGKSAAAHVDIIHTLANHPRQQLAVEQAFAWSMRNMWIMYACAAFIGVVLSLFVRKAHLGQEHTETITGLKKKETLS